MGSDRKKDMDEKNKSGSTTREGKGKSRKRHRREEDEEQVEDDHHKSKTSSSRRDRDRDKDKDEKKKKKRKDHKHRSKRHKDDNFKDNFQELSKDDYFSKNNEFATWLKEERSVFFSNLSSESAHKLFGDFVKEWNDQKLESRYYEGIASGPRSAHNWAFKK